MREPWLRVDNGSCVNGPQTHHVYELSVCNLLLPNAKRWDENKIYSMFSLEDAHDILTVPLFDLVREDKLIWKEENNGVYSVRSGYRKLMEVENRGYCSGRDDGWRSLWKIHAPPKTKHLLWRLCRECLPTRSRLRSRYVTCPLECPLCLSQDETDWHLFFNCGAVKDAWQNMGLSHIIEPRLLMFNNSRDFIFDICRNATEVEASKVAVLVWFLWQHRNNVVWNENNATLLQVGVQACTYWTQWTACNALSLARQQPEIQQTTATSLLQWQQPSPGHLKCNVDASFYNMAGATGWGWVVRDSRGHFHLAGTNIIHSPLSILEGEAMALLEAMEEATHRGLSPIIFESDSKLVVDAISSRQSGVSEFSILITRIQSLLRSNNYFEVKYVKRQANKVAHYLATAAFSLSRRRVFDLVPPCIATYLINEMC
jgi:ribonuclease HI